MPQPTFNPYQLESLEARILLSGDAPLSLDPVCTSEPGFGASSEITITKSTPGSPGSSTYDPAAVVESIFGGVGGAAGSDSEADHAGGSGDGAPAPEEAEGLATPERQPASPFPRLECQGPLPAAGDGPALSPADLLVETLHAANGPPDSPRILSPGHSPGVMTITIPEIWSGGETYEWEINDVAGKEGETAHGWDLISVTNELMIQATTANPFTLKVKSLLLSNADGPLSGFDPTKAYAWRILKTSGGISGFDRSVFQIDTSQFASFNAMGNGAFVLDQSSNGKELLLRFLPSFPKVLVDETPTWVEQGPYQIESSDQSEGFIAGAITSLAIHPFNPDIIFVGSASGGVWRTTNGTGAQPDWTPLGQSLPSLFIGALTLSPFDRLAHPLQANTPVDDLVLYAGTGSFSSVQNLGVPGFGAAGVFKSTDGGMHWTATGTTGTSALLSPYRVRSIAASASNPNLVLVGTADATFSGGGLYRSTDGGDTWIAVAAGSGLGHGSVSDIKRDPGNNSRFYVALAGPFDTNLDGQFSDDDNASPGNGIYRSDNNGDTWVLADAGIRTAADFDNIDGDNDQKDDQQDGREGLKLAPKILLAVSPVHPAPGSNPIFAAVINPRGEMGGIFRSVDAGVSWLPLGAPPPTPQGQGSIHLSLVADPLDPNVVYLGGDIPPNIFRGDAATAGLVTFTLVSNDPTYGQTVRLPWVPVSVNSGQKPAAAAASGPATGEAGGGQAQGLLKALGEITVAESSGVTVVREGGVPDTYTVVLKQQPEFDLRVDFETSSDLMVEDAAHPGVKFLTFPAAQWNVPQTVNVRAIDNGKADPGGRTRTIKHSLAPADPNRPEHFNGDQPKVEVRVVDGIFPGITVELTRAKKDAPETTVVSEVGGSDDFLVFLNHQPSDTVRVFLSTNGQVTAESADHPGQLFLEFTPQNWSTPQRVLVKAVADALEYDTWRHLVFANAQGTAPHPDSRGMAFDSNGDLLEVDDGGIYRLVKLNDEAQRKWIPLNRGLRLNEVSVAVAWDSLTHTAIAGSQDNGTPEQSVGNPQHWIDISGGDGFFVAVDNSTPGVSIRYSISNQIATMVRRAIDAQGNVVSSTKVQLASAPGGAYLSGIDDTVALGDLVKGTDRRIQFFPIHVVLNAVNPSRVLIGRTFLYESANGTLGDVVQQLADPANGRVVHSLAYGGRFNGLDDGDVIYVGRGNQISVRFRNPNTKALEWRSSNPPGASIDTSISDIALDPENWMVAYAVDETHVWVTADGGVSWNDVTLNLGRLTTSFRSIEVVRRDRQLAVLVGGSDGVYRLMGDEFGLDEAWTRFGNNLPNVRVTDIDFVADAALADVLIIGTQGRGVWTMANAKDQLFKESVLRIEGAAGPDEIRLVLADSDGAVPTELEVWFKNDLQESVPLEAILRVVVHTGDDNDRLIVDNSFGPVTVPIEYDGGGGVDDRLVFQGNYAGELLSRPLEAMDERRLDDQVVRTRNVETSVNAGILRSFGEVAGDGMRRLAEWTRGLNGEALLGRNLPLFGDSLGSAFNGVRQPEAGIGDRPGEEGEEEEAGLTSDLFTQAGGAILRRLFESGTGAFLLDEIGRSLVTPEAIRQAFDALDGTAGNVTFTSVVGDTRFDIHVSKTISGEAAIEVEALGGLLELEGRLGVSATAALHLVLGVDAGGFYLDAAAVAGPELVLSDLKVSGLEGVGRFGFLAVRLEGGSLATDASVTIAVDFHEPGPDIYSNVADGRIRLFELVPNLEGLTTVTLSGGGTQDLVVTGEFTVGVTELDGEPLFDIGTATIKLTWADINNPFRVKVEAVGGPAEVITKFLNFSPDEALTELRRYANYLKQLSTSPLLDIKLPFGGGVTLGGTFDFSTEFIDRVFAKLTDTQLFNVIPSGGLSASLSLGRLSGDAKFFVQIGSAAPVAVTVHLAAMLNNQSLVDLASDLNASLTAAGLDGQIHAVLDGDRISFKLLAGADLKVTGDPSNPFFAEMGFRNNQLGVELPRFPTLQELFEQLDEWLDPDGDGPLTLSMRPRYDMATHEFTFHVIIGGIGLTRTIPFKFDPNIGLGDLVDISASGSFGLEISLDLAFVVGFDFNALGTPKLNTSFTLPPPSSGVLQGASHFTINLNDGARYAFTLDASVTANNHALSDLVQDLNNLILSSNYQFEGSPLSSVVRFVQAKTGNALILEVINEDLDADGNQDIDEDTNQNKLLDDGEDKDQDGHLDVDEDTVLANGMFDTWLNKVQSLALEAQDSDPIVTEVGFNNTQPARSTIKGLFLENVFLLGGLVLKADNLAAKARLAIFEVSTSDGSAVGSASLTLSFQNPHEKDPLRSRRIDLDALLKHLSDITKYVTLDTQLAGSLDIQLKHITVTPNLPTLSGQPLLPNDALFRVYIPDLHDLHYNAAPYVPGVNDKGVFVTHPNLGAIGQFSCASFLDIVNILDALSDQLEGLKSFSFLSQPLPLINTSISDILDYAGDLARAFKNLASGDTAAISKLEADLEKLFGIGPDQFAILLDYTPNPKTAGGSAGTAAQATFNPSGLNNSIQFTATSNGAELNDVQIEFLDDGSLTPETDVATATYDATKKVLTVRYNATYTTAAKIAQAVIDAHMNDPALPFTAAVVSSMGDTDSLGHGLVTQTALKFHLAFGLSYGNFLPLQFNLGSLAALVSDPSVKSFLAGVADLVQLEGSANLNVTASATLTLDFGLDASSACGLVPFVYDSTGIALKAAIRGTNLNFKIGIGGLNVSIKNGTVTVDGDGDPATTNDSAAFTITFKDTDGDGRHYFRPGFFDLSNLDIGLTAGASAVLPLYALGALPLGSTSDNNHDGFADNVLAVRVPDLVELFTGDLSNAIQIATPDIASLFDDINVCDLAAHPELLIDGLDALLGTIQSALGNRVFSRRLPLVGPQLGKAADFIGEFRSGLLADLRAKLVEAGDPILLIKKAIFNTLGPPGLDILASPVDGSPITSAEQVDIVCQANGLVFNLRLKRSAALIDTTRDPLDFNLGFDGLGLKVHANLKVEVGFDLKLKFGINPTDGFYLDTSDPQELLVNFKVTIPQLRATGELFFLQLDVSDEADGKDLQGNPRSASKFEGAFAVDLKDPVGSGNKVTFAEMLNGAFDFSKFVEAKLGAEAGLHLDLAVSFGGSARFPRLVAEFDLTWKWDPFGGDPDGDLQFGFHNLSLDIGSFVSDFVRPILQELHKYTEPLQPLVDVLTARLPIVSDLLGRDYTLIDLAETWGLISPGTRKFIDVVLAIVDLANDNSVSNNGDILLPLGGFNLNLDKFGRVQRKAGETDPPPAKLDKVKEPHALGFLNKLEKIGITFPFLEVSELFKLFTGKTVSFVEYHLPVLDFEASIAVRVPIFGPLFAKFGGSLSAHIDLTVGYDSFGLQKFLASKDKNALDLFDGFYLKDVNADGEDIPEITFGGSLWAAATIDLVAVEAGVRGGFEATVTFNLNDPDDDGRVHLNELIANARMDVRCIFDIHGEFTAFLEAFIRVDLFFIHVDEKFRFADVTLLTFDLVCPVPVLANYVDASGNELPAADAGGLLRLNLGPYADQREEGDTEDGNETFVVHHIDGDAAAGETVEVSFMGLKQTYHGVRAIYADGGEGSDVIDLRGVLVPASAAKGGVRGGPGNDQLFAGRGGGPFFGDAGDDVLLGETAEGDFAGANDEFHGGSGADTLTGKEGDDQLSGDGGADVIHGDAGHDSIDGGAANDQLFGDEGDDFISGGDGADRLEGALGADTLAGDGGDDLLDGGRDDDRLMGGPGDDVLEGGPGDDVLLGDLGTIVTRLHVTGVDGDGNDLIAGGAGSDVIFGAGGRDSLFGGTLLESGQTQITETDEEDFIDGGDDDDVVFADDAHSAAVTSFPGANIGDAVWFDALDQNGFRNGLRDSGEFGVAGVIVELFNAGNQLIAATTTDAAGEFRFIGLPAGDYFLTFTLPAGLDFTLRDAGDDTLDSDPDPLTGRTAIFHVEAGQADLNQDAGLKGTTPVLTIDNVSLTEGDTGVTALVFNVTLSNPSEQVISVCYASDPQTAARIFDYDTVDWTLVFAPGQTRQTIAVPIHGDLVDELDETFLVHLDDPTNATLDPAHSVGQGTILDDDAPPTVNVSNGVQIDPTPLDDTPPPETTPVTFTVSLSHPSWRPIILNYLTGGVVDDSGQLVADAARPGNDYSNAFEVVPGLLLFLPGETEKSITIDALGDGLDEYDEQFLLELSLHPALPPSAASLDDHEGFGLIHDDDATPFVRWAPISQTINEGHAGNTPVAFEIRLFDANGMPTVSGRTVIVSWNTSRGTAVNAPPDGELPDFVYKFENVNFAPGVFSVLVQAEVIGDTRVEPDEFFFLNLLNAVNGMLDVTDDNFNHAVVHITNDESGDPGPWYIEFGRPVFTVSEDAGMAEITLTRAEGSSEPFAVYWTLAGTATPGVDYIGVWENDTAGKRGVVAFAEGESTKSFFLPILDDNIYEGNEVVQLFLRNPSGGPVRSATKTAALVIVENDPLPTVTVSDATNVAGPDLPPGVGESAGIDLRFEVTVTGNTSLPVTVTWDTANGSAIANDDYVPGGGLLNFGPVSGSAITSVFVTVKPDLLPEGLERLLVHLSNIANAAITDYEGRGHIYDDDPATVTGFVFFDGNGNGFFDAGVDYGLAGVSVKVTDSFGEQLVPTNPTGNFAAPVHIGSVTVEALESTGPAGSAVSSGNSPQTHDVSLTGLTLKPIGFALAPKQGQPVTSIGNGLAFFNDTAYGGPGNDRLDGGPGDDWLVGGHWLGPGCACSGNPYEATLLQQQAADGGHFYVDPASLPTPGAIQGRVWIDANPNNQDIDGEAGLGGMQVNLFDENWTLIATTWTAPILGTYRFENLAPCNYRVQFLPPAGYKFALKDVGSDTRDSDATISTGLTDLYQVGAGVTINDVAAGLQPLPAPSAGPWSLEFSQLIYSARETDGQALIHILRTPNSSEPAGSYFTRDGTATDLLDYLGIQGTLFFGEGDHERPLVIAVAQDNLDEGFETVFLFLRNPAGGPVTGNLPVAVLLIFDNPCPDNDTLSGSDGADFILGDFGFFTAAGAPVLRGGMGDDVLEGGAGADHLYGEGGNDLLEGGASDDTLDGGSENDTYRFDGDQSLGTDVIVETAGPFGGSDTLDLSITTAWAVTLDLGNTAAQVVTPSLTLTLPAGDVIENAIGGFREDVVVGNALNNVLQGGAGADQLTGGPGNDQLAGGPGDDLFWFDADGPLGVDRLIEAAGEGRDRIDFSATTLQPVHLNLALVVSQPVAPTLNLTLSSAAGIEDLYGGAQNDVLLGNALDNVIQGGPGNDQLDGGVGGSDTLLEARAGDFQLTNSTLSLGAETDTYANFDEVSLVGDDTPNILNAAAFGGTVRLDGRGGADTLIGGSGVNFFTGGPGDDVIDGTLGLDIIVEERDADFSLSNTLLRIGAETDTFVGMIEAARLTGGPGNNILSAAFFTGVVQLDGSAGNDTLVGTAGADLLMGGAGDDVLSGRDGNDFYVFDADTDLGSDRIIESTAGGIDTVEFSLTNTLGITLDLSVATLQTVNVSLSLTLSAGDALENVRGSQQDDLLIGNNLPNRLEGFLGSDTLTGGPGNDFLDGGANVLFPIITIYSDRVVEARDANWVLNNGSLTSGLETDQLVGIEQAILTGGDSGNTLDASGFTNGPVTLDGGGGNDFLFGGSGPDVLVGGAGNDQLAGGAGDDTYVFDADSPLDTDTVTENNGGGVDTLDYSATTTLNISVNLSLGFQITALTSTLQIRQVLAFAGNREIENVIGGALNDILTGNDLANALSGLSGDDRLSGGAGNDHLQGGDGDDTYAFDVDLLLGSDSIMEEVGRGGMDTLDFSATTGRSITFDLSVGTSQTVDSPVTPNLILGLFTCHSLENIMGGELADDLRGNSLANRLEGRGGDDHLAGGRGDDTYAFDTDTNLGQDTVEEVADSEGGVDSVDFSETTSLGVIVNLSLSLQQTVNGNLRLTLMGPSSVENATGGAQADVLIGNAFANVLRGGGGADVLQAGAGDDLLEGGEGADLLNGGEANDRYVFQNGWGADTIAETAGQGLDTLDFTDVTLDLTFSLTGPVAVGAGLNQVQSAFGQLERFFGGSGFDTFNVTAPLDTPYTLSGGAGAGIDRLVYDAQGLVVDLNPGLIGAAGRFDVAYAEFEVVNILNPAP